MLPNIDALANLQISGVHDFHKGDEIAVADCHVHVILSGEVKVRQASGSGWVILDIYGADQIVGEGALIGNTSEVATAVTAVRVMSWSADQIRSGNPQLILALLQLALQRSSERATRLVELASLCIEDRIKAALLRLAQNIGTPVEGGREMTALTHETLSEYVGTSREIVTHYMNHFRRLGLVGYSRRSIVVYPAAFVAAVKAAA